MGFRLDPTEWGFRIKNGLLVPVMIDNGVRMAPDAVLDFINCSCIMGCKSNPCSCVKLRMPCNFSCTNCEGRDCDNAAEY